MNDGYLLKLIRARTQLEDLQIQLRTWMSGERCRAFTEPDGSEPNCFVVKVSVLGSVPIDPFALMIGEVLHGLRGALDHLAYALASKHTVPLPEDVAQQSEFPIFGDKNRKGNLGAGRHMFDSSGIAKIRGVDPAAQAIIKSLQPYHRGNNYTAHPLWQLHDLSNIDKHRLLPIAFFHSGGAGFVPSRSANVALIPTGFQVYGGFIEDQTIVVRYYAEPVDRSQEMHMEFFPIIKVAFRCGSVVDGEDAIKGLIDIYNYIVTDVIPPLRVFL